MFEVLVEFWIGLTLIGKIGVGSFVVGVALTMLGDFVIRGWKKRAFERIFSIAPETHYSAMKIQTPILVRELESRASVLSHLFDREEELLKKYDEEKAFSYQCQDDLDSWKAIHEDIKLAKKRFWQALDIATYFGYDLFLNLGEEPSWSDFVKSDFV